MNLQDILTLVSGPQGWLLIGGGILLLLVLLVYRRIGKLAAGTRNDLAELRQTMTQLADRLDTVHGALTSISAAGGEDRASLALAASIDTEEPEASGEDTYGYTVAPGTGDDADLTEAGVLFTPDTASEPPAEWPGAAEEPKASGEDTYGYTVAPGTGDDADLTEAGALFTPDTASEPPAEWPDAAEEPEVSGEDTYGYTVAPGTGDDADLTEAGALFTPDAASEPPAEWPDAAEEPEVSGEDTYGYTAAPGTGDDADLTEFEQGPAPDIEGEFPGELQHAAQAQEAFDEFQFGTGADKESSLETEQRAEDEQEASFPSSEELESFTFGSGGQIPEGDAVDLAQSESREEPPPAVQSSSDDALETTGQSPSEIAIDSTATSQPAPQISTLEPLPGDPDRPQVGVARCGECGRKIAYPKRLSGKRMRCPACRATSILP